MLRQQRKLCETAKTACSPQTLVTLAARPHWAHDVPSSQATSRAHAPHNSILAAPRVASVSRQAASPSAPLVQPGLVSWDSIPAHQPIQEPQAGASELSRSLSELQAYWADGVPQDQLEGQALRAAYSIKQLVATAVNTRAEGIRQLQASITAAGAVEPLVTLALRRHPVAYQALQILCYRNNVTCKAVIKSGIIEKISVILPMTSDLELQSQMCFLLSGLVAFCPSFAEEPIINAGLVPQLVAICRSQTQASASGSGHPTPQTRALAVLRNLAHNTKNHSLLINAGAVDALYDIIRTDKEPASQVNAAVAIACLVGHEEGNPKLQLSEDLVVELLQVLQAACKGELRHGTFWTVWKLAMGLASLTVNDRNKELITNHYGVEVLAQVLQGKHHQNEAAHRYAVSALWNLAFNEQSRQRIIATEGLVDTIRSKLHSADSGPKMKEIVKGALWTLGLEQDIRTLQEGRASSSHTRRSIDGDADGSDREASACQGIPHVMLSYEWGSQQSVLLLKQELQKAGYAVWMDVDQMSGSTLEAMARAVEGSAAVIVCVSKRYKESQACRTEAEYAFQQRKKIIPVLMERDYRPSGWLGALIGTRLYFQCHDVRQLAAKMPAVIKELGDAGKLSEGALASMRGQGSIALSAERPENWTHADVEEWLKRIRCHEYIDHFKSRDIDGPALSGLFRMATDYKYLHEVLSADLGLTQLGQRLRFVEELHRVFSQAS